MARAHALQGATRPMAAGMNSFFRFLGKLRATCGLTRMKERHSEQAIGRSTGSAMDRVARFGVAIPSSKVQPRREGD
jgi:hypothetical protein